ncbi:anti-sigma factor [Arthrobacter sp. CDRTa11]|nr:anti-sigma factor [Arthrobacter sp. CDRTa11]
MHRERQYIERLRQSAVPPASQDLTARLLAQTQLLAAATPEPAPAQHLAVKVLAFTAGGTAAAAGVLAVGAFAMAGDSFPVAGNGLEGSLAQQTAQVPADGRQLSEAQLAGLRSQGWVCPELESLGFHLQSARATTLDGHPAVEMQLWDGKHYARILEQHDAAEQPGMGSGYGVADQDPSQLRAGSTSPWTFTYQTPAGRFTYESDLPADQADDALPVLQKLSATAAAGINVRVAPEPATAVAGGREESISDRLQRGFRKITEMLTR